MFNQLRIKFVAFVMLVATILVCFLLTLLYQATAFAMEADHIEMMQSIEGGSPPNGFSPEEDSPDDRLHYFMLTKTPQGELTVIENTGFDLTDTGLLNELYDFANQNTEDVGELEEYALRYSQMTDAYTSSYIFSDISDEYTILRSLRNSCILIGIMSLFILGIFTNILSRVIIRPVEQAWEQQKQFVADASHELKTPLTVISTNVEMLASPDYNQTQKSELVNNIAAMTQRMRSLVEGLLDLARVDNGAVKNPSPRSIIPSWWSKACFPLNPCFLKADVFCSLILHQTSVCTAAHPISVRSRIFCWTTH